MSLRRATPFPLRIRLMAAGGIDGCEERVPARRLIEGASTPGADRVNRTENSRQLGSAQVTEAAMTGQGSGPPPADGRAPKPRPRDRV